jgi:hypothetical protein
LTQAWLTKLHEGWMTNAVTRSKTTWPLSQSFEALEVIETRTCVSDDAPAPLGTRLTFEPFGTIGETVSLHCAAIAGAPDTPKRIAA